MTNSSPTLNGPCEPTDSNSFLNKEPADMSVGELCCAKEYWEECVEKAAGWASAKASAQFLAQIIAEANRRGATWANKFPIVTGKPTPAPTPCVTPDIITRLAELDKKRVYRNYVRGRYSGDCTLFSDNGDERSIAASFSRAQDAEFMQALEEAWPLLRKVFLDVPTGWKLVPVEPTEAMVWTGHKAGEESLTGGDLIDMAAAYRAMLDAAPELRSLSLARGENCVDLSGTNQQPPRSSLEGGK